MILFITGSTSPKAFLIKALEQSAYM